MQADVEIVRGGRGDDTIKGTTADEELYGGAGDDELTTGGGDDLLDGGAGDDYLRSLDSRYGHLLCGAGTDQYERDQGSRGESADGARDVIAACEVEVINPVIG